VLVKFTFSAAGNLALSEQWPLQVGPYWLEWQTNDGLVTGVTASKSISEEDTLPTISTGHGRIKAHIHAGFHPSHSQLESDLRLIQGALSLFASISIDFSSQKTEWIAEFEEEESKIELYSISAEEDRSHLQEPLHLDFEWVALAVAAVGDIQDLEIPLSFLRRGGECISQGRFIEGFYNLFFYFETQFAAGLSNPKRVKQRLLAATPVRQGLTALRASALVMGRKADANLVAKLQLSDEAILEELVSLRGHLHHHSKGKVRWHPDKGEAFRIDTQLLSALATQTAIAQLQSTMFSAECQKRAAETAKANGADVSLRALVDLQLGEDQKTVEITISVASLTFKRELIERACVQLNRKLPQDFPMHRLLKYDLFLKESGDLLAKYVRYNVDEDSLRQADVSSIRVFFSYTGQLKRDPLKKGSAPVMQLSQHLLVEMKLPHGLEKLRADKLIEQAEAAFLSEATGLDAKTEIVEWEARLHSSKGPSLSSFRVWWPANRY